MDSADTGYGSIKGWNLQTSWATKLQGRDCAVGFVESWNFGINNANDRRYIQQITSTILGFSTVRHYTCLATAVCLFSGATAPPWARASSFTRFLDHTQRRTTVGRTPLDKWSTRRRDLYLTTHNTHNRQISMPPVGFEPTISAGERPQTYALDRDTTGTGSAVLTILSSYFPNIIFLLPFSINGFTSMYLRCCYQETITAIMAFYPLNITSWLKCFMFYGFTCIYKINL